MLFPKHKYLGPGNPVPNGPPVDNDDWIAYVHDVAYTKTTTPEDVRQADREAIASFSEDWKQNNNWHSLIGAAGLGAKYLGESMVGVQYGVSSPHRKRNREADSEAGPSKRVPRTPTYENDDTDGGSVNTISSRSASANNSSNGSAPSSQERYPRAGPGSGSGSTGAMGMATVPIFSGIIQTPNVAHFTYNKEYRFFMVSSKTKAVAKAPDADRYVHFIPGSVHDIPWDRVQLYLSPREIFFLRTNFTKVICNKVDVEVHTLGVRLPFETNAGVSTTANANVQMPIFELFNCDQYYPTNTKAENIEDFLNKCRGDSIYRGNEAAINLEVFPNLSAMTETRKMNNPLEILLPRLRRTNQDGNVVDAMREQHNEPLMTQVMTKVLNGSNHLGLAFKHDYEPSNGVLWEHATNTTINTLKKTNQDDALHSGLNYNRHSHTNNVGNHTENSVYWNDHPKYQKIENILYCHPMSPLPHKTQPRFPIGMYNLRNIDAEQSIVQAQWEFIIRAQMHVTAVVGVPGVYGRTDIVPEANYMYPAQRPGSTRHPIRPSQHEERFLYNTPMVANAEEIPPQLSDKQANPKEPDARRSASQLPDILLTQQPPALNQTVDQTAKKQQSGISLQTKQQSK